MQVFSYLFLTFFLFFSFFFYFFRKLSILLSEREGEMRSHAQPHLNAKKGNLEKAIQTKLKTRQIEKPHAWVLRA
jgi:hypothetical protein